MTAPNSILLSLGAVAALAATGVALNRRGSGARSTIKTSSHAIASVRTAMNKVFKQMGVDPNDPDGPFRGERWDDDHVKYDPYGYLSDARLVALELTSANDFPHKRRPKWLQGSLIPLDALHELENALVAARSGLRLTTAMSFPPLRKGTRNDGDELVSYQHRGLARTDGQQRELAPILQLSDAQLWDLVEHNGDVLGGLSFADATRDDPRRIDAMIWQAVFVPFKRIMGDHPMAAQMRKTAYLRSMALIRETTGGAITAAGLESLQYETWQDLWQMVNRGLPPGTRQMLRPHLGAFDEAFDMAIQIAKKAAAQVRGTDDNVTWKNYAQTLDEQKHSLHQLMAPALPGPVGRHRLGGGGRRRLT